MVRSDETDDEFEEFEWFDRHWFSISLNSVNLVKPFVFFFYPKMLFKGINDIIININRNFT